MSPWSVIPGSMWRPVNPDAPTVRVLAVLEDGYVAVRPGAGKPIVWDVPAFLGNYELVSS